MVIIGNKADCEDTEVTEEELAAFTLKYGVDCLRVSAKSGHGVGAAFETVAKKCLKTFGKVTN